jgi:hypothetical protein
MKKFLHVDVLICRVERSPATRFAEWLRRRGAVVLSALREVFDESAYERFLVRGKVTSSVESYAAFEKEQEGLKARRTKCC